MSFYPYVISGLVFIIGLSGVVASRNYIHLAVCLTVMQSSTYLALISVGYVHNGQAPITKGATPGKPYVDAIVQALTLTDIVVSVAVLALVLSLAMRAHRTHGTINPDQMHEMHG